MRNERLFMHTDTLCVGVMHLCFGWELATGDGAIPKAGNKGAGGSSGATEPSANGSTRDRVVLKPERARAEQSEQHGRRGAWRRGAERVLVQADDLRYFFQLEGDKIASLEILP